MEFIDLVSQQKRIKSSIDARIQKILAHGQYILGPEVKELEQTLAKHVGVKHCVGISSGTDALLVALMALGAKAGDEVITTPFTFFATGSMPMLLGIKPVFVDVDAKTYNMDPMLIERALTKKTKAIIPVSLYGQCADFDAINAIGKKHGVPVIEDAAQSFGATYKGRQSCSLSEISCTSFFPSKPLGGYGDGGACFTNDDQLAQDMREIMTHGQSRRYYHTRLGINGRLDTMQAAILLAKMEVFADEIKAREKIGARYSEKIKARLGDKVVTPWIAPDCTTPYAQYTVQVANRERVQEFLKEKGVPTAVHYPIPLNLQPVFKYLEQPEGSFPVAEAAAKRVMSLPMHPYLSDKDMDSIVEALAYAVEKAGA